MGETLGRKHARYVFRPTVKFDHKYPAYFPQSASNPQKAWCYPEAALGEFRRWFRETYIGEGRFAAYVLGKAKDKQIPASFAQLAIAAYSAEESSGQV
jgi:hypothetical protein